jgi:opacity protein-like surface antigen
MRKGMLLGIILITCFCEGYGQYGGRFGGPRGGYRRERVRELETFKPSLDVSVGYGFPNLDSYLLADFYNYYTGHASYSGPIIASIDYHFSRRMAIGLMVNYGKVSQPYYNYYSGEHEFNGEMTNTAVMLNFTRYLGYSQKIMPYTRTAIGINTGEGKYSNLDGSKFADISGGTSLAYQAGLGVQFNATKHGGFFVEAGYGKYIVAAGLTMRF